MPEGTTSRSRRAGSIHATRVVVACVAATVARTNSSASPPPRSPPAARHERTTSNRLFDARTVPKNATDLFVPEPSVTIGGSTWGGGWLKLIQLTDDGAGVNEGDVVARFEFIGKGMWPRLESQLNQTVAESEESRIKLAEELRQLEIEKRRKTLAAERAALETRRADTVSKHQMAKYQIEQRMAEFEALAAEKRVAALNQRIAGEESYWQKKLARVRGLVALYHFHENRFTLRAPHAGIVRHAFHSHMRRKIQNGDGLPGGMTTLSVARDPTVWLEIFVPEHRAYSLKINDPLVALDPASGEEYPAAIEEIDAFPQEMGFLLENQDLPNARDKAHVVRARFVEQPKGISAGLELRVRMP